MTRFEKFATSPYYNVHKDTIRLLKLLRKYHPDFPEMRIQKEKVFQRLFPGKAYDDTRLYTLKSNLLKLVYGFFAAEEAAESPREQYILSLKGISRRNQVKYMPRLIEEGREQIKKDPHRDYHHYYDAYGLEKFGYDFMITHSNRSRNLGLQKVSDELDKFYLLQKIMNATAMINRKQILGIEYEMGPLENLLPYLQEFPAADGPLIAMYYRVYLMLTDAGGSPHYKELKNLLADFGGFVPEDDKNNLYSFAINFCNRKYREGDLDYLEEMFNLYNRMLEDNLLFQSYEASAIHYRNLVTLGLRLRKFDWTEAFILNYKDKILPEYREGTLHYNLAQTYFYKAEYRKALKELQKVEFIDTFNRTNYYILLFKAYYECEDIEPLFSLCNTFGTFLRRNQSLSKGHLTAYRNLVKFFRMLARIKYDLKWDQVGKFASEMADCPSLVERKWLEEKISELTMENVNT
jgi:hypothetical protein